MEISLLIRIQNLQELADWVKMLQLFPTFGKAINMEQGVDGLIKQVETLKEEIKQLEQQKASLIQTPASAI